MHVLELKAAAAYRAADIALMAAGAAFISAYDDTLDADGVPDAVALAAARASYRAAMTSHRAAGLAVDAATAYAARELAAVAS